MKEQTNAQAASPLSITGAGGNTSGAVHGPAPAGNTQGPLKNRIKVIPSKSIKVMQSESN